MTDRIGVEIGLFASLLATLSPYPLRVTQTGPNGAVPS